MSQWQASDVISHKGTVPICETYFPALTFMHSTCWTNCCGSILTKGSQLSKHFTTFTCTGTWTYSFSMCTCNHCTWHVHQILSLSLYMPYRFHCPDNEPTLDHDVVLSLNDCTQLSVQNYQETLYKVRRWPSWGLHFDTTLGYITNASNTEIRRETPSTSFHIRYRITSNC